MKQIVCLAFVFLISWTALARNYSFHHLVSPEALACRSVNAIIKDKQGFMWFGAYDGLLRFDGYSVKSYLYDPDDPHFGEKSDVRVLAEWKDSLLLVGTLYGLCIYNREKDSFSRLVHTDSVTGSLSHNNIIAITIDSKDRIWIGTQSGLDLFDPSERSFKHFDFYRNKFVAGIAEDTNGILWIYGGKDLVRFDPNRNEARSFVFSEHPGIDDPYCLQGLITADKQGNLWIGNKLEGLTIFNPETGRISIFNEKNSAFSSDLVSAILCTEDNTIWVGTDGDGLFRYNPEKNNFTRYIHEEGVAGTLSGNAIHALYECKGKIWLGIYGLGIDILAADMTQFHKLTGKGKVGKKLLQNSVLALTETFDHKILIGTDGGGLHVFDRAKGRVEKYLTEENGMLCGDVVKAITTDYNHDVWIGTYRRGFCVINLETGKNINMRSWPHQENNLMKDNVWALKRAKDGRVWIGLLAGGLQIYDPVKETFENHSFENYQPNHAPCNVLCIFEDRKQRIWIGTETAGVIWYDPVKRKFNRLYIKKKSGKEILNNIRQIYEDERGQIWFATKGGGLKKLISLSDKDWKTFTTVNGLPTNNVFSIQEDAHNNLWLSTDAGISCFQQRENRFVNFGEDHNVLKGFNTNSSLKAQDGYLYFGSVEGLNYFHPDSIRYNAVPPPVVITGFRVFNHSLKTGEEFRGKRFLNQSIETTSEISIRYKDNIFSIEFAGLSYESPDQNQYAYKLEGFDSEWTYVDSEKRFASFTNLDPGTYYFRVIASNSDGFWNTKGKTLKIVVLPPWWQTWWFRILTGLFLVCLIVSIVYIRTWSVRKRNRFLEAEIQKQTAALKNINSDLREKNREISLKNSILVQNNQEIHAKSEQILEQQNEILQQKEKLVQLNNTKDKLFSIIAHDLKNPVLSIAVLTNMLEQDLAGVSSGQRDIIYNLGISVTRIKDLVLNLLDWVRAQRDEIHLTPENIDLKKLFREIVELYSTQAFNKQINLSFELSGNSYVRADYNTLSAVIRNLVSNSLKFTSRGGTIRLSAEEENDGMVLIMVKDNGKGMPQEMIERLLKKSENTLLQGTENETGTGLGLTIVKDFTDLNGGKIKVRSEEGSGTCFYLSLSGGNKDQGLMDQGKRTVKNERIIESSGIKSESRAIQIADIAEKSSEADGKDFIHKTFKGKKVLLVDDDPQVRNVVRMILSPYFEVIESEDVDQAVILTRKALPDIVVSDITMPGVSGISFCQTLKENRLTSHIPVLLLTGQDSSNVHLEGLQAGADAYITKPFDRKIFLTTLNNLLASIENLRLRFSSDTAYVPSEYTHNKLDEELMERLIALVEQNISDPELNGTFLSRELGISKSVLYAKLKNITGQSVNEFVRILRLKKSINLLFEGKLNIAEISTEMGFNSPSYYTKSFRKYFSLSPSEYVAMHRNKV